MKAYLLVIAASGVTFSSPLNLSLLFPLPCVWLRFILILLYNKFLKLLKATGRQRCNKNNRGERGGHQELEQWCHQMASTTSTAKGFTSPHNMSEGRDLFHSKKQTNKTNGEKQTNLVKCSRQRNRKIS